MTRDQAAAAIARLHHDPLIRYWSEELDIARRFVDALIVIGVFVPDEGARKTPSSEMWLRESERPRDQ